MILRSSFPTRIRIGQLNNYTLAKLDPSRESDSVTPKEAKALHKEIVGAGKMSEKQFNDTVLTYSSMPIELIRAGMLGERVPTYGDPLYAAAALAILTLLGLIFTRDVRKHIEIG